MRMTSDAVRMSVHVRVRVHCALYSRRRPVMIFFLRRSHEELDHTIQSIDLFSGLVFLPGQDSLYRLTLPLVVIAHALLRLRVWIPR